MPLYFELSHARRQRVLHPWHVAIFAEYLLAAKRESYWERGDRPRAVHELTDQDITDDMIVVWTLLREELEADVVRDFRQRSHEVESDSADVVAQGLVPPSLREILLKLLEERDFLKIGKIYAPYRACLRAERDLHGLVGMRVAACHSKLSLDEVFGPEVPPAPATP